MYIIIIGCGRFGSKLAKDLSNEGNDICIIDRDGDKLESLGSGFNGQRLKGIEFDSDNLIEAGIRQAEALIAVSSEDNINITVSMIAKKIFEVPKIFARVNDPEKTYFYDKLVINTINPIQYEIELIKGRLPIGSIDVIATFDDNYEMLEILVDKDKKIPINKLEDRFQCNISALRKDGKISLPKKNDIITKGIRLYCIVDRNDKEKLINYLCKENLI